MRHPVIGRRLVAVSAAIVASIALVSAQPAPTPAYTTRFYMRGGLRLESYLYLPDGAGLAPLVVYNHGSRVGAERVERPFPWIARFLTAAGYAVLVPERRGYGKSAGATFTEDVGSDRGARFVARLQAETDDGLAAMDDVIAMGGSRIDRGRMAIMGWSFGGIVSVLGAARRPELRALVTQAPGALNWDRSSALRETLIDAAGHLRMPVQCLVAANDATIESAKRICAKARAAGAAAVFALYPAFTPPERSDIPPGHLLFGADGVSLWEKDVLAFLNASMHAPQLD